jgi:hypothetical protein
VAEIQIGTRRRPGAIIFSSDPSSEYIQDEPRPSRVLKPVTRAEMAKLLAELDGAGLSSLPHDALADDEKITGERQFVLIREGKKTGYPRSATQSDARLFTAFTRCEKLLLDRAHGRDEFIETRGRDATPDMKPVNAPK